MKVLQVNSVYPLWSTGKITHDIHMVLLQEGHQSVVCYGRGDDINNVPGVYKICSEKISRLNRAWSRLSGIMYGGHILSTRYLIQIIKKEKPDIVHLQCINNYFINIHASELWCWRGVLKVPWTARRSNRLILKEINLEYSLEELMLKLDLQSFGH